MLKMFRPALAAALLAMLAACASSSSSVDPGNGGGPSVADLLAFSNEASNPNLLPPAYLNCDATGATTTATGSTNGNSATTTNGSVCQPNAIRRGGVNLGAAALQQSTTQVTTPTTP